MTDHISKEKLREFVDDATYLMASHPAQKVMRDLAAEVIKLREEVVELMLALPYNALDS